MTAQNEDAPDFASIANAALAQADHLHARHVLKQHIADLQERWRMEDGEKAIPGQPCPAE